MSDQRLAAEHWPSGGDPSGQWMVSVVTLRGGHYTQSKINVKYMIYPAI